ncbi:hypothetical protein B0H34DRAFT_774191 [Crassisporium funariophilum]|nr:hypothetical protein B0H34DRAFT_774191 [Crassisporium funariophilum]
MVEHRTQPDSRTGVILLSTTSSLYSPPITALVLGGELATPTPTPQYACTAFGISVYISWLI